MSPTQTVFAAATVVATRVNGEFWATHCVLQSTAMGVSAILTDIDVELSRLQQARDLLAGPAAPIKRRGRPKHFRE